jgi:ribonuclease Z
MIEINFLGTGSAVPTERRNHLSVLLRYKNENILFDCGEGTQRQFRKAKINPCKLTRIFVSHWHGDHVLGIPGLLQTLVLNNYGKTLKIYGPKGTKRYFELIMKIFIGIGKIDYEIFEISSGVVVRENDFEITAEKMNHGAECLAYSFIEKDQLKIDKNKLAKLKIGNSPKLKELKKGKSVIINGKKINYKDVTYTQKGKKVVFVVDTRINNEIKKILRDADLLISEATYLNESDIAEEYGHLTAEQICMIAKKSDVKKLVLVHLSQRYESSEKEFLLFTKKIFKNTEIAEDFMKVSV